MVGDKRKFNVVLITLKAVGATGERAGAMLMMMVMMTMLLLLLLLLMCKRRVPCFLLNAALTCVQGGNDLEQASMVHCSAGVTTISQVASRSHMSRVTCHVSCVMCHVYISSGHG